LLLERRRVLSEWDAVPGLVEVKDDHHETTVVVGVDRAQRDSTKFLRAHLFQDRHRADQVMRRFRESRGIGFRGQKIETAINLKCVCADDFCIEIARDVGRELRFSGGGWADDEENAFHQVGTSLRDVRLIF